MTGKSCTSVRSGLDCILSERLDLLAGRRVGLVTSSSAVTCDVTLAVDALRSVCNLVALYGPEHGITGHQADAANIPSTVDERTGLPVYSLYGETRKPTAEMLEGVDVLVFDIQDVGVRFYTYVWTMSYVMEAAAECGVPLIVLDRPNPVGGLICEGPMTEPGYESFVGRGAVPLRHGLTVGEMALLLNSEHGLGAQPLGVDLTVVEAEGWRRAMWFDQTDLPWVIPSPSMPKLDTAIVYPGTCLFEGTNATTGRGTTTPFEGIGAPWIDSYRLAAAVNELALPGVRFRPIFFTPTAFRYTGEWCQGVFVHVTDRETFRPVRSILHLVATIKALWPDEFAWRESSWEGRPPHFDLLIGNSWVREQLDAGRPVDEIVASWQETLSRFEELRSRFLLYE